MDSCANQPSEGDKTEGCELFLETLRAAERRFGKSMRGILQLPEREFEDVQDQILEHFERNLTLHVSPKWGWYGDESEAVSMLLAKAQMKWSIDRLFADGYDEESSAMAELKFSCEDLK